MTLPRGIFQAQIDGSGRMSERTTAYKIDAGFPDGAHPIQGHPSRSLQDSPPPVLNDGFPEKIEGEIVQKDNVGACTEGFRELFQILDFDLNLQQVTSLPTRSADRFPDTPHGSNVIVLDEDSIG